ncbi:ATP-binding protein [Nocardiopsis terrae]|uniref:Energy-coupling factor transporter ATP-binding protein EcfA2 n=1 Tax=Nocardiopsis terrae TaxID=372655 RepID=A0ABR9HLT3_9ACTN|nr:AAA family ATPase [Nocardiopsis terrae]MBE1459964.1 energy-coupling factor transporter ATP-binding protein EcfA2 [Nocardiopsis terrae]GHC93129.1 ATP-binding protein [Nocardiopsis terrae]
MAKHPITRLDAFAFGPFRDISVDLAPGLNVIVGDNATGKSQLLKLLYTGTKSLHEAEVLTKKELSSAIASKLVGTFRPESLGRLCRRVQGTGRTNVSMKYSGIREPLSFSFSSKATREVVMNQVPHRPLEDEPVFLPSHELLSLAATFVALYNTRETPFEETWRDTAELLQRPALLGPKGKRANTILKPFSDLLQGGTVFERDGRFFLKQPGIGNLEAPLLAEGHRKLAMIVRLIASGVLLEGGYLFWDEPEANLNPRSQRAVAHALIHLASQGSQIFVATHSMFLLRELQMSSGDVAPRYIGLERRRSDNENVAAAEVTAQASDDLDELDFIAALEAEAEQSDRYLAW